jgi:hypothetical protein
MILSKVFCLVELTRLELVQTLLRARIITGMSQQVRHRSRWIILVAVAALAAVTACTSSGSSTGAKGTRPAQPSAATSATESGQPASAILASALAALRAGPSVHLHGLTKSSGHVSVLSQDSGADAGRQVFTIDGNVHATVLVVGGVGYIKGNAAALTGFFGFPAALATRLVGRWILVPPWGLGRENQLSGGDLGRDARQRR